MDFTDHLGIADVAKQTGLTQDTLRWYERQGVIPPVPRRGDGRRSYDEASVRIIQLIAAHGHAGGRYAAVLRDGDGGGGEPWASDGSAA